MPQRRLGHAVKAEFPPGRRTDRAADSSEEAWVSRSDRFKDVSSGIGARVPCCSGASSCSLWNLDGERKDLGRCSSG